MKYQFMCLGIAFISSLVLSASSQLAFASEKDTINTHIANMAEEQLLFAPSAQSEVAFESEPMDYKAAIKELDAQIKKNPKDASLYEQRGNLKGAIGKNKKALKDLNKAIRLNPKSDTAYNSRGSIKANMGKLKMAIKDFTTAIELNPKNDNAYNNRGVMKMALRDNAGALADINQALKINPKNVQAQQNRKEVLFLIEN